MQNEADMQARQYQAQVQMEMQAREEQARMARLALPITQQEQMRNQAKMNGILEIERMVSEGTMTKEQGGLARLELLGEVNAFNDRMKFQQAKAVQQQTEMQAKMFSDNQKNIALGKQFAKAQGGAEIMEKWNPETGDVDLFDYDTQNGMWQKIGVRKPPAPEKAAGRFADETTGHFSYKKALPELEAEAKIAFPVKHEKDADGKGSVDVNEAARADYIQQLARREEEAHRQAVNERQTRQRSPITAPQQQGQQQVDPEIAKLQAKGLPPDQLQFATQVVQLMRALIEKGKSGELSPPEKAQLATAIQQYQSFQR